MPQVTAEQLTKAKKWADYFERYGDHAAAELIRTSCGIEWDG